MLLFLLPLLVPPITYGIPMATVLYKAGLGGTMCGRDPRQSRAFAALRHPGHDPLRRADRSAHRGGGPRLRRRHLPASSSMCCCRCCFPASWRRCCWCSCAPSRMFELTFLTSGPDEPDARRLALLLGLRRRRPRGAVDRRHGGDLHGDDAGLAPDRAALRQPDADRGARQATARAVTGATGVSSRRSAGASAHKRARRSSRRNHTPSVSPERGSTNRSAVSSQSGAGRPLERPALVAAAAEQEPDQHRERDGPAQMSERDHHAAGSITAAVP